MQESENPGLSHDVKNIRRAELFQEYKNLSREDKEAFEHQYRESQSALRAERAEESARAMVDPPDPTGSLTPWDIGDVEWPISLAIVQGVFDEHDETQKSIERLQQDGVSVKWTKRKSGWKAGTALDRVSRFDMEARPCKCDFAF
jgi:hypothetical protein